VTATTPAGSAGYDAWSATYDRDDNPMVAMAEQALADRLPRLAGRRVLELGCGTGRNADALLAAGVSRYVGIDGSAGMLARACERIADARASWLHGDLFDEGVVTPDAGGFDLVLFSLVLEHVAALAPAFARARTALAPGGQVLALEIHPELRAGGTQAHFWADGQEVALASYPHTVASLRDAVAGAGLELVSTTDRHATSADVARCRKLAKHGGRAVLLELVARRP
jgi:SAM-dependent methyltransferase